MGEKAILLKTLLLSKVNFLGNVPITNSIQQQLETVFKYIIRTYSQRNALPLKKSRMNRLNTIQSKLHNFAMQIKHFLKIIKKSFWMILTRYNLASILYRIHKQFRYMISNKTIKTIVTRKNLFITCYFF